MCAPLRALPRICSRALSPAPCLHRGRPPPSRLPGRTSSRTVCPPFDPRQNARAFNQPLSFDTSSVTLMQSMFQSASAFNQPLRFDTSRVTNMQSMFNAATSLSAANKLLIRCAWAGTSAFASAGYGLSWAAGTCTSSS